jgi:hypothetical protein
MLSRTNLRAASLRYRRPYWMLHLQGADNWRIYVQLPKDAGHQRVEMEYQAWLGGLDRPYVRPRCMAFQPLWLEKKRHMLQRPDLQDPQTPLERYVLDWQAKFFSFKGTLRPTVEDMHVAFDLVERPLDLSYAIQILGWCRNVNDIHFARDSFEIFLEACLRVDRKDVAVAALQTHEKLGFWHVDPQIRAFLEGRTESYKAAPKADGRVSSRAADVAPAAAPAAQAATGVAAAAAPDAAASAAAAALSEEEAALEAELRALEEEERRLAAETQK